MIRKKTYIKSPPLKIRKDYLPIIRGIIGLSVKLFLLLPGKKSFIYSLLKHPAEKNLIMKKAKTLLKMITNKAEIIQEVKYYEKQL
ncbi:MAG: hypothetical protein GX425_16715 [Peptococcaceae bacterium]|nr:hypothetical protein [Peptococcaceae bacterium]